MFETQLGLRENPFRAGHHPRFLYPSRGHQEALAHLRHGIRDRQPFVLITGEIGTGKTIAVYDALGEWGSRAVVALITDPALTRVELLEEIRLRFGIDFPGSPGAPPAPEPLEQLLGGLRARGELAILLLDQAQDLDPRLLEEICRLSDLELHGEKLLLTILVGQPELEAKLARPELSELRERIGIRFRIPPLGATETTDYIHHRVTAAGGNAPELFPTDTCLEMFRITHGIPRDINVVAGQALRHALAEDSRTVTAEHVRAIARELGFQSAVHHPAVTPPPAAAPPSAAPPQELMPLPARQAETQRVEPLPEPNRAMVPDPFPVKFPPLMPLAPAVQSEPAPVPEPAANAFEPPPTRPTTVDRGVPILPSWFDEIVAERKRIDEQQAADAPTLGPPAAPFPPAAPAQASEPPASIPEFLPATPALAPQPPAGSPTFVPTVPARALEPPVGIPRFVPTAPALAPQPPASIPTLVPPAPAMAAAANLTEPAPDSQIPEPGSTAARLAALQLEPLRIPDLSTAPIDFMSRRARAQSAEEEELATRTRGGSPWLVAAASVAVVVISAILFLRFGPWTLQRRSPAPLAQASAPATDVAAAPRAHATPPTPAPTHGRPQQKEVAPPTSGPATVGASTSITAAVKPPATVTVRQTPVPSPSAAATNPAPGGTTASKRPAGRRNSPTPAAAKSPAVVADLFGIAVGTYLDEARANAVRTSLTESTRLPSRIVTVAEDSVSIYRVVMGSFEDRASAEQAASDLIRRGLVDETRVIPLARTTPTPP
jgi:general secretion pathway protein A